MRITDRYQTLMERTGSAATRSSEKTEKSRALPAKDAGRPSSFDSSRGILDVSVSAGAQKLAAGAARLDELRAQIENGTYRIDAHAIASRLVGEDA